MADGMAVLEPLETSQAESAEQPQQTESTTQDTSQKQTPDPFAPKSAKEYGDWLKSLKADPANSKFARMSQDNFGRMRALQQIEPRGIDGVREMYAQMNSVIHTDPERGELKGAEAIAAMQDAVRQYAATDEALISGDPKALEELGQEFDDGLAKLTPHLLSRLAQSNPEAYASAVLPHFVQALAQSDLVRDYNGMVDVLSERIPDWLPEDKKSAWQADREKRVVALASRMGSWLNAQAEKAGKAAPAAEKGEAKPDKLSQERDAFEKERQEVHWSTKIAPELDKHASQTFSKLFQPYAKRLRLDAPTTAALKSEFSRRVASTAAKDKNYIAQIGRYRATKNPDPATVVNFAKVQFDKHSKTVMDALVNERYRPFLASKPKISPVNQQSNVARTGPVAPNVQIVTVKPKNIDYKGTRIEWLHQKKYRTMDGKVVQWKQ